MILTRPDMRSLRSIGGDGNCLFRALCYIISGSEAQHGELRRAIVAHMRTIPFLVSGTGPDGNRNYLVTHDGGYHSVDDYLARSDMAENGVWGGDFEMCILAHMLDTLIYSYQESTTKCQCAFIVYFLEAPPFPGCHCCEEKAYILKGCQGTMCCLSKSSFMFANLGSYLIRSSSGFEVYWLS